MRGCGEREPFALASGLLFGDSITQVTAAQPRVQSVDPGLASSRCLGLRPRPRTTGLVSWPIPVSRFPRLSRGWGLPPPTARRPKASRLRVRQRGPLRDTAPVARFSAWGVTAPGGGAASQYWTRVFLSLGEPV